MSTTTHTQSAAHSDRALFLADRFGPHLKVRTVKTILTTPSYHFRSTTLFLS